MEMGKNGHEGADGSISSEDFRALNPTGYVPALDVDGTMITEMPAILTFIGSLSQDRQLLGRTSLERSQVLEWMAYLSGTLHGIGYAELWRPARFVGTAASVGIQDIVRLNGRAIIERSYEWIENKIAGNLNAINAHFTVVDIQLHTFWRWGSQVGFDMNPYPKFAAVVREAEMLESVRKAMALENEALLFEAEKL